MKPAYRSLNELDEQIGLIGSIWAALYFMGIDLLPYVCKISFSFLLLNPSEGDVREALPGAGGAPGAPPIFLCSRAPKRSKIMFLHKFGSFPTDLSLF